jgi:hypothetical protein
MRAGRPKAELLLTDEERELLQSFARSRSLARRGMVGLADLCEVHPKTKEMGRFPDCSVKYRG